MGEFWWKYESDKRFYYLIHKEPDFVNNELLFNIMNGVGPDLTLF